MKTKIIVISMIVVLLLAGISALNVTGYKTGFNNIILNDEELIEEQLECNDGIMLERTWTREDGLKCSAMGICQQILIDQKHCKQLTKVSIYVAKVGEIQLDLIVGIGEDICDCISGGQPGLKTAVSVPYSEISQSYKWIECDFNDINLDHTNKYFLYLKYGGGSQEVTYSNCYFIGFHQDDDVYQGSDMLEKANCYGHNRVSMGYQTHENDDLCFKTFGILGNTAPEVPPTPKGPETGKKGSFYYFYTSAIDIENDRVYYLFDWGDGTDSGWLGPFNSGEEVKTRHKWGAVDNYSIYVKAKDDYDKSESYWCADPLNISIEKRGNGFQKDYIINDIAFGKLMKVLRMYNFISYFSKLFSI